MKPYYSDEFVTLYHADCREASDDVWQGCDLVLSDPPYPDQHKEKYQYSDDLVSVFSNMSCRQFVFWTPKVAFPLTYTAIHVWDKKTGCGSEYEHLYERHGAKNWKVFRHYLINSTVAASYTRDVFTGHPSQKPKALLMSVLSYAKRASKIFDPFCGSGSTLVAAKESGRQVVGIERNEKYCEIAANRCAQSVAPALLAEAVS